MYYNNNNNKKKKKKKNKIQCQLSILSPIFPGKVFSEKDSSIYVDAWETLVLITKGTLYQYKCIIYIYI